jgi:hypothetical protein
MRSHIGLQQQGMNQQRMMSLLGFGMQPQFENAYQPAQPGFAQSLAHGGGEAIGKLPLLLSLLAGGGPGWLAKLFS